MSDSFYVTVVGTRYFGGVKLGIGGLVRAYRACATAGLDEAGRSAQTQFGSLSVIVPYDLVGIVMREAAVAAGEVASVDYRESEVCICCLAPLGKIEDFVIKLSDLTRGKAKIINVNTKYKGKAVEGQR
ncbi:MAG: YigZ family protein [Dethiobacter sp.]|jgi:putative IMPACT (imprinted ancient) family translation regulator|nr:YigZ family protein [Dethiobacter sp.]